MGTLHHSVTLQTDGGTIASGKRSKRNRLHLLRTGGSSSYHHDITREGYRLTGWHADSNFSGSPVTSQVPDTGNKTFYAKWTRNTTPIILRKHTN